MNEREYDYINKIFENQLNDKLVNRFLAFTNDIKPFLESFISSCKILPSLECHFKNDRIFYNAFSYIRERHSNYYSELLRMYSKKEIHIYPNENNIAECNSYNGEIWIGVSKTIIDDSNLVHEFFHHQNLIPINKEGKQNSMARALFGESISIAAQLDFAKQISDSDLREDSKKIEVDYINDGIKCARKVIVELSLIDIYKTYGKINTECIKDYSLNCCDDNMRELIMSEYVNVLKGIYKWGENLKFPFNLKYILGITIGYFISDLVDANPDKWEDIYDINSNFYNISPNDFLQKLGINFHDGIILSNFIEHYQQLSENYKQDKK